MVDIKKVEKSEFDLEHYTLHLGDDASYNVYFTISINYNNGLFNIGLQIPDTGIPPQVTVFNNHIIIGAYKAVFIWNPDTNALMQYELSSPFYEFFVVTDSIIVVYELGVIALSKSFNKKWEKSFSEIIDIETIDKNFLIIKDFNGKIIKVDVLTGKCA